MSAAVVESPGGLTVDARGHVVGDSMTMVWRNLLNVRRTPQLLVFATIQPVVFVILFRYVFGGAVQASLPAGQHYVNFLMPGIFVQTMVFGTMNTAIGLADDLNQGLIDRFRSLPIARSAVLVGRTGADLVRNVFVVVLISIVGYLVGWRPDNGFSGAVGAILITVALSYALSWMFATIGLTVRNSETAQAVAFPIMAPLVFASSAFVPVATMPSWLQGWAKNQPVSVVVEAARYLSIGGPTTSPSSVWKAVAWIAGMTVVFSALAVARYRRAT